VNLEEAGDSDEQKSLTGPREDRRLRSRRCFAFESELSGLSCADDDGSRTTDREAANRQTAPGTAPTTRSRSCCCRRRRWRRRGEREMQGGGRMDLARRSPN
jgi:hypothetical protein